MGKPKLTPAQELLRIHIFELGHSPVVPEYKFCAWRKFKFDLYVPSLRMGFECDGGQFGGGHMRGKALEQQYEKDRLAQLLGFRVMRFTNREVLTGAAKDFLKPWIAEKGK